MYCSHLDIYSVGDNLLLRHTTVTLNSNCKNTATTFLFQNIHGRWLSTTEVCPTQEFFSLQRALFEFHRVRSSILNVLVVS